jgi:hypothetical protein
MTNLFEPNVADLMISRLNTLTPGTQALWGKMNCAQMVKHCQAPFEVFFGNMEMKRSIIGMVFGKMARKKLFTDKPWKKSLPTAKEFIVTGQPEFEKEKSSLIEMIRRFAKEGSSAPDMMHPFFGKMTAQEWAMLSYKHLDHHLQQFGA